MMKIMTIMRMRRRMRMMRTLGMLMRTAPLSC